MVVTDRSRASVPARTGSSPHPPRARVLVLEDEGVVASDLRSMLDGFGYIAHTVASGEQAIASANEVAPDVLLADIRVPGAIDGIETAVRLRAEHGTDTVFLTAHADEATVDRAKCAEPCGYLLKPVSASAVRAAIELSLDRRVREARRRVQARTVTPGSGHLLCALNHIPLAVLLEDQQRRVLHVNAAFCSMFALETGPEAPAYTDSTALCERIGSLCDSPAELSQALDRLRSLHEPASCELLALTDGRMLERDHIPLFENGARSGRLWVYRDVTQRERGRLASEQSAVRRRVAAMSEHLALSTRREDLTDELTGLANRAGFNRLAGTYLGMVNAQQRRMTNKVVFVLSAGGPAASAAALGGAPDDAVLCQIAGALRDTFRESDLLARIGAGEFAVLATMWASEIGRTRFLLFAHLASHHAAAGGPFETRIGAVEWRSGESLEALLARAREALAEGDSGR